MNNFKDVAKSLIRAGAALTVEHADELKSEVTQAGEGSIISS
jgi:3-deoxy-D-manno-octulosonic-acid transferase